MCATSTSPLACSSGSTTFEENSTLEGILGELIVPTVKHKELILCEKGLVCLGLCCLIVWHMALNLFQLFLSQVQAVPEVLKLHVLQVVFDVLMVHEGDFLANASIGVCWFHYLWHFPCELIQAFLCCQQGGWVILAWTGVHMHC